MSRLNRRLAATVGTLFVANAGIAVADDATEAVTPDGVAVSLGLGVEDFTGETMRDTTDTCGSWEVRAVVGTRSYLGFEAAYVGGATGVYAPLGSDDAILVNTTIEALVRANLIPDRAFEPYAFAGGAWRRYDIANGDFTMADTGMNDKDNEVLIPVGAGLSYRYRGVLADARFTFRVATGEDLVLDDAMTSSDDHAPMHTWGVTTRIGYEF